MVLVEKKRLEKPRTGEVLWEKKTKKFNYSPWFPYPSPVTGTQAKSTDCLLSRGLNNFQN